MMENESNAAFNTILVSRAAKCDDWRNCFDKDLLFRFDIHQRSRLAQKNLLRVPSLGWIENHKM
jgi:hypothetical protein